ncbi:hypothetical protein RDI58_016321 [Solanum bulbocastanum]|uniref:Uncharacterized protein n=1 Tax=Solanum bulbocastanum TaxID=147425 RepID=A0AAN8YDM8_SOLBU
MDKFGNGNKLERNLHSGKVIENLYKHSDYELTLCVIYYQNEHSSLQQYQPHIDITDIASTSTMQPRDEKIGDTSNSNIVDSIDQNKLEICVAAVSQDDKDHQLITKIMIFNN